MLLQDKLSNKIVVLGRYMYMNSRSSSLCTVQEFLENPVLNGIDYKDTEVYDAVLTYTKRPEYGSDYETDRYDKVTFGSYMNKRLNNLIGILYLDTLAQPKSPFNALYDGSFRYDAVDAAMYMKDLDVIRYYLNIKPSVELVEHLVLKIRDLDLLHDMEKLYFNYDIIPMGNYIIDDEGNINVTDMKIDEYKQHFKELLRDHLDSLY